MVRVTILRNRPLNILRDLFTSKFSLFLVGIEKCKTVIIIMKYFVLSKIYLMFAYMWIYFVGTEGYKFSRYFAVLGFQNLRYHIELVN